MNLDSIVNPGDIGGIRTATAVDSRVMHAPPVSQIRRSTKPRSEQSPGTGRHQQRTLSAKVQRKRHTDEHRVRGGATSSTLHNISPARMDATSSRHRRHRQPHDRPSGALPAARQGGSIPSPSSSPAKDLLRRAQQCAATDTDASGRRPFIMDLILGDRPVVSQYSEDIIMEAIELSRDALRPAAGTPTLADARSLELRWEGQADEVFTAASGNSPQLMSAGYQVSAERTTATWSRNETSLPDMSPSNHISLPPELDMPQHM
ncbi:hypothetical protein BD414DRAFT_451489 [Trametes punicea]|nr:hypothetical protein BD414DRAFT_451489 [Trametes punicea]